MRTHTTLTLRTLIVNDMDADKHKLTKQEISVWLGSLPDITRELFETIYFFTHSIFQKRLIGRQVRQIQTECINLLDHIDKYQNLPVEIDGLKTATIKCLDQVLEKITSDCETYLDMETRIPVLHLKREKVAVENDMNLLVNALKNMGADGKLQKLIMEGMADLLKAKRCSYYRLAYVKQLQESLMELSRRTTKTRIDEDLLNLLLSLNYNTAEFTKYYQQKVSDELAACIAEEEQFKYLWAWENYFGNRHHRRSVPGYDKKRRKTSQVLYDFVKLELNIREKRTAELRQELHTSALASATKENGGVVPNVRLGNYKIRTPLSVDALAYLIKLMVQARVIDPGVRTELLAFVATIFQTPGTGLTGISAGSLGTKYKNVVQTSARTIRVLLVRMLMLLDDEFEVK
uniref:hypothetical protein n=1 Tax=Pedobacter schmidteae TaxID=2201271 RepID=UPI000EAB7F05|nr:hypothetical protein [Pedobacter schmidteae]